MKLCGFGHQIDNDLKNGVFLRYDKPVQMVQTMGASQKIDRSSGLGILYRHAKQAMLITCHDPPKLCVRFILFEV